MCELEATVELVVELCKFYNIDLFQRGFYRIRTELRASHKIPIKIEATLRKCERKDILLPACADEAAGTSRTFRLLYRNEEVTLEDTILYRVHMLVDSHKIEEMLEDAKFCLVVELWFTEVLTAGREATITCVSSRTMQLNFNYSKGLHYHLPVMFDYFHLSAVTITIHACLIALHHPYIKRGLLQLVQSCASKGSRSWIGANSQKLSFWMPHAGIDSVFSRSLGAKYVNSHSAYVSHVKHTYRDICAILLLSYQSLRKTVIEYFKLLPPWQRKKLRTTECVQKLQNLGDLSKISNDDELFAKANSDIAQLCAETILLWKQFLDTFCEREAIRQHLAKHHHQLRVKRFAEAFFVVDNPRQSATGCYDQNYQNYLAVSDMVRRSRYWNSLPPLPVHCVEVDGNLNTLPIIFEDQYQDVAEFARRRSVVGFRRKSSGSDPTVDSYLNLENKPINTIENTRSLVGDPEDCSCGIAKILESRAQKKTSTTKSMYSKSYLTDVEDMDSSPQKEDGYMKNSGDTRHCKSLEHLQRSCCDDDNDSEVTLYVEFPCCQPTSQFTDENADIYTLPITSYDDDDEEGEPENVPSAYRKESKDIEDTYAKIIRKGRKKEKCAEYMINGIEKQSKENSYVSEYSDSAIEMRENHNDIQWTKSSSDSSKPSVDAQIYAKPRLSSSTTSSDPARYSKPSSHSSDMSSHLGSRAVNGKNVYGSRAMYNDDTSSSDSCGSSFIPIAAKRNESSIVNDGQNGIKPSGYGIRHSFSAISMPDFGGVTGNALSSSESMPNILLNKIRRSRPTKLPSSVSESDITSERSGWISSPSSINISTAYATPTTDTGSDRIRNQYGKLFHDYSVGMAELEMSSKWGNNCKKEVPNNPFKGLRYIQKAADPIMGPNNQPVEIKKPIARKPLLHGSVMPPEREYEKLNLLPPKQFQDIPPPPPEPFRDPPQPLDKMFYYLCETMKDIQKQKRMADFEKSPLLGAMMHNQLSKDENNHKEEKIEDDDCGLNDNILAQIYPMDEEEPVSDFEKYKEEFKSQLNFTGMLYSDFPTLASTLPYFHISEDYRLFSPEGLHLIVCVHGLEGSAGDLRLVKTYIELGLPGANLDFLMSEHNQGDTFSGFETMSDRLVKEILCHIEACNLVPSKISFVAHSLGNIIVRAAVARPQFKPLLPKLHTFLSLSGPHLGTMYNPSGLVNLGLWFMQKFKKSGTLLQLSLRDSPNIRETFLYRLSKNCHLKYFKHVLLFGSSQDRYVPLHSARIELCKAAIKDNSTTGKAYREMARNILFPIIEKSEVTLVRYDVHHVLPHTANSLIGRAAHIALLDSDLFIEKFFVVTGLKYFR